MVVYENSGVYYNDKKQQCEFWHVFRYLNKKNNKIYHYQELVDVLPYDRKIEKYEYLLKMNQWGIKIAQKILDEIDERVAKIPFA